MDIENRVTEIISEQLSVNPEDINPKHQLIKDLKANSLDVVELIMSLEESFNLQIPDDEAEYLLSLNDFINYIKKKSK